MRKFQNLRGKKPKNSSKDILDPQTFDQKIKELRSESRPNKIKELLKDTYDERRKQIKEKFSFDFIFETFPIFKNPKWAFHEAQLIFQTQTKIEEIEERWKEMEEVIKKLFEDEEEEEALKICFQKLQKNPNWDDLCTELQVFIYFISIFSLFLYLLYNFFFFFKKIGWRNSKARKKPEVICLPFKMFYYWS